MPVYVGGSSMMALLSFDLWRKFKIAELDEVMRQKGDHQFIDLLNKI